MEYTLHRVQRVSTPLGETFDFFSRPENLARITPPWLGFRMVSDDTDMREGLRIEYRVKPLRLLFRAAIAALFVLFAPAPLAAQDPPDSQRADAPGLSLPVVEDTLENGLRVLALHRPGAPTASFVLRFDVGAVNEAAGQTGIAHFLEHLLFKGTTTVGTSGLAEERALFEVMDAVQDSLLMGAEGGLDGGVVQQLEARIEALEDSARAYSVPNEFDRILTEHGARDMNATTGYEGTTYYVRLPANRAELWFVLEADRMMNPVFREFYAERDVVAEERRSRVDADPGGALLEAFYAAAYREHPYGRPVIGHMADIETHTRPEVAAYHARYYRPNNAVVAVVGDIEPERVVRWARRYFGSIPAGQEPQRVTAEEPEQTAERRVRVSFDAEPELVIGWRVPDAFHADAPALAVLTRVLAGGKTARLYRRLVVEEGIATGVSASVGPGMRGPRLLTVAAQPLAGTTTGELEAAIYDELSRLVSEPPSDTELARVRNQAEVGEVGRLTSNLGLALQLAESVAYHGSWRETFRYSERIAGVTARDVQRVAARYLTATNRTVAVLTPPDADAAAEETGASEGVGDGGAR